MEERCFKRGEIYVANLSPYIGSEQGGTRPVIILQNNLGNSLVLLEQIKTIDKQRMGEYIGKVSDRELKSIEKAVTISLGFEIPVEIDAP